MKTNNYYFLLAVFLLTMLNACSDNEGVDTYVKEVPKEIREDIDKRFEKYRYEYSHANNEDILVVLNNENGNKVSLLYDLNNRFQVEYQQIQSIADLTEIVKSAFYKAMPSDIDMSSLVIYKTERSYLKNDLYSFHFDDVKRIYINDDGTVLALHQPFPLGGTNDEVMLFNNYVEQYQFVKENYAGADVRAQFYSTDRCLVVLHDGYQKSIRFAKDGASDQFIWKETEYEVALDYPLPSRVLEKLKAKNPDFVYSELILTETPFEEQYTFLNRDLSGVIGYTVRDEK